MNLQSKCPNSISPAETVIAVINKIIPMSSALFYVCVDGRCLDPKELLVGVRGAKQLKQRLVSACQQHWQLTVNMASMVLVYRTKWRARPSDFLCRFQNYRKSEQVFCTFSVLFVNVIHILSVAKIHRKVAYNQTSEQVAKWEPIVKHNTKVRFVDRAIPFYGRSLCGQVLS